MTVALSPETAALVDLAHQTSCAAWAGQQGWKLRRAGQELIGSCPKCAGDDRFAINLIKDVWNCRGCGVGGDVIFLVQHVEGLRLRQACERITGRTVETLPDPEEQARVSERRRRDESEAQATNERYRQQARREAWNIWDAGKDKDPAALGDYLGTLRGLAGGSIDFAHPSWLAGMPLRLQPLRTYFHNGKALHSGPAMLAAIQGPDGHFSGVHQTWLDLSLPKGKLVLPVQPGDSKAPPSKKVLGIKKRGAIRLLSPAGARRMVVGEGIETTLTALAFAEQPHTAYWAAVDLGNMAGRVARWASGGMAHDQPDMDDSDCFLPPDWVEELIYLCDGDEPEKHTVEKVTRGLRRAQRRRDGDRLHGEDLPPLKISIVPPGEAGTDLNSIAMGAEVEIGDEQPKGLDGAVGDL